MAKARNKRRGRPRSQEPGIVYRLTITLHPRRDAAIIARVEAAEQGQRSAVIVDMMRNGVGSLLMESPVKIEMVHDEQVAHEPVAADF